MEQKEFFQKQKFYLLKIKQNKKEHELKKKHKIYTFDEDYFENINSREKAYFLGLLYTDGTITFPINGSQCKISLVLSGQDGKELLEKFKQKINFTGPITKYLPKSKKDINTNQISYKISLFSNKMGEDLINLGVLPNKTYICKYPKQSILNNFEKDFVRGLIDGDGCISISYPKNIKFREKFFLTFTGTKEMCNGILKFFSKENIKLSQRYKYQTENHINNFTLKSNIYFQIIFTTRFRVYSEIS